MHRKWVVGLAIVLLVALFAGAIYVAASLIRTQKFGPQAGEGGPDGIRITFNRATEIPAQQPDLFGLVKGLNNNTLLVSPQSKTQPEGGPQVDVVIVRNTRVYRDASLDRVPRPDKSETLQQVLEPISMSRLEQEKTVEMWGHRRGDGWIADLIVAFDD
jgi:hypothetical protein